MMQKQLGAVCMHLLGQLKGQQIGQPITEFLASYCLQESYY